MEICGGGYPGMCVPQLWMCHENLSSPERGRSTTFNIYKLYVISFIYICDRALKPKPQFEVSQFSKVNKTSSDGGITVDFWIIKVHTSN